MVDYSEVRLIKTTEVECIEGIVYTSICIDGRPFTIALALHDYILHHKRGAKAIDDGFTNKGNVVAWR